MRIFLYFFLLSILSLHAVGCSLAPKSNVSPIVPFEKKFSDINIGQIQTKTVGEAITTQIDALETVGFVADKNMQLPKSVTTFPMLIYGTKIKAKYKYENGLYYCEPENELMAEPPLGKPFRVCFVIDAQGYLKGNAGCGYPQYWLEIKEWQHLQLKPEAMIEKGSFRQELLYNGKSSNTIKLQYREYKDDFARPAFYQDLSYDLNESKVIGFRGMQIEIIEANNSSIKYKVLSQ